MDETSEHIPEPVHPAETGDRKLSFFERHQLHPILFAGVSLIVIFVFYQVIGGIVTFFILGSSSIGRENVWTIRWLTLLGQLFLILLPTLLFAKLFSVKLRSVFPFRIPGIRESTLALIALFSLQRLFEAYMFFQDRIPLPQLLREFIDPIKKMMEELIKILLHVESPVELLAVIFIIAVVPSIVEELLFRGLIQKVFERLMSPLVAAILSGTIFGLFHVNPLELVPLIGLGVFFGILRFRSQSLWLPISAHFFNNLLAVLAVYYGLAQENSLESLQSDVDVQMMVFQFAAFAALFFISFVAYLRLTHNISKNTYWKEFH